MCFKYVNYKSENFRLNPIVMCKFIFYLLICFGVFLAVIWCCCCCDFYSWCWIFLCFYCCCIIALSSWSLVMSLCQQRHCNVISCRLNCFSVCPFFIYLFIMLFVFFNRLSSLVCVSACIFLLLSPGP